MHSAQPTCGLERAVEHSKVNVKTQGDGGFPALLFELLAC